MNFSAHELRLIKAEADIAKRNGGLKGLTFAGNSYMFLAREYRKAA